MRLTDEMYNAMLENRMDYVKSNPNRCNTESKANRYWREHLTRAWLNDWPEQWGMLRSVRNDVGIEAAFKQFFATYNSG